jgi:hypothetical protein
MPIQQELMDWHHCLYHLSFPKIFCLAEKGYLPKNLLKCKGALPLCIACQFGTAHRCLWRMRGKASGSIRCLKHILPGEGVSVDQIVSAQPVLIPQMSGFLQVAAFGVALHFVIMLVTLFTSTSCKITRWTRQFWWSRLSKRSWLKPTAPSSIIMPTTARSHIKVFWMRSIGRTRR